MMSSGAVLIVDGFVLNRYLKRNIHFDPSRFIEDLEIIQANICDVHVYCTVDSKSMAPSSCFENVKRCQVHYIPSSSFTSSSETTSPALNMALGTKIIECAYGVNGTHEADSIIVVTCDENLLQAIMCAEGKKHGIVRIIPTEINHNSPLSKYQYQRLEGDSIVAVTLSSLLGEQNVSQNGSNSNNEVEACRFSVNHTMNAALAQQSLIGHPLASTDLTHQVAEIVSPIEQTARLSKSQRKALKRKLDDENVGQLIGERGARIYSEDLGEFNYLKNCTIIISGSKNSTVNGEYRVAGVMNSAAMFELKLASKTTRVLIYRGVCQQLPSHNTSADTAYSWKLAQVPYNSTSETSVDTQHYCCDESIIALGGGNKVNPLPPVNGWQCMAKKQRTEDFNVEIKNNEHISPTQTVQSVSYASTTTQHLLPKSSLMLMPNTTQASQTTSQSALLNLNPSSNRNSATKQSFGEKTVNAKLSNTDSVFGQSVAGYINGDRDKNESHVTNIHTGDLGELNYLKNSRVVVSGSKVTATNGEYRVIGVMNNAALFELKLTSKTTRVLIYRGECQYPKHKSLHHDSSWIIAQVPYSSTPGTSVDVQHYCCDEPMEALGDENQANPLPPVNGWKVIAKKQRTEDFKVEIKNSEQRNFVQASKLVPTTSTVNPITAASGCLTMPDSGGTAHMHRVDHGSYSTRAMLTTTQALRNLNAPSIHNSVLSQPKLTSVRALLVSATMQSVLLAKRHDSRDESDGEVREDDDKVDDNSNENVQSAKRVKVSDINITIAVPPICIDNLVGTDNMNVSDVVAEQAQQTHIDFETMQRAITSYRKERFMQRETLPHNTFGLMESNFSGYLRDKQLVVSGAGTTAVNGVYHARGIMNGTRYYEKPCRNGRFSIYWCHLTKSGQYVWFLSFVPQNESLPGSSRDVNLYYSPCTSSAVPPLPDGVWFCMTDDFRTDTCISVTVVVSPPDMLAGDRDGTGVPQPLDGSNPGIHDDQFAKTFAELIATVTGTGDPDFIKKLAESTSHCLSLMCVEFSLDLLIVLAAAQIVYTFIDGLQLSRDVANAAKFVSFTACEMFATDTYDVTCNKILSCMFPAMSIEEIEQHMFATLSEIEILGGVFSDEGCLIPLYRLCCAISDVWLRWSTVNAATKALIECNDAVDNCNTDCEKGHGRANPISGMQQIASDTKFESTGVVDLANNYVKLFQHLFPQSHGFLPYSQFFIELFKKTVNSSGLDQELILEVYGQIYDFLCSLSEQDVRREKLNFEIRINKKQIQKNRNTTICRCEDILMNVFPYLSRIIIINELNRLNGIICSTLNLMIEQNMAHMPIVLICDKLHKST